MSTVKIALFPHTTEDTFISVGEQTFPAAYTAAEVIEQIGSPYFIDYDEDENMCLCLTVDEETQPLIAVANDDDMHYQYEITSKIFIGPRPPHK